MHIMINGFYLSLNNIFIITEISKGNAESYFQILYHPNKTECNFGYAPKMDNEVDCIYGHFYFKDRQKLIETRNRILNLLTNAAQLNETRKSL